MKDNTYSAKGRQKKRFNGEEITEKTTANNNHIPLPPPPVVSQLAAWQQMETQDLTQHLGL